MGILPSASERPAVSYDYFPTPWQAVIWRNWGHLPAVRIARALSATEAQIRDGAARLGLDPDIRPDPAWAVRGYQGIIRENWHLCSFRQILTLLEITDEALAFLLKEDDFLWQKLGGFKPRTAEPRYRPLTGEEIRRTDRLVARLRDTLPAGSTYTDNAFAFVNDYRAPLTDEERCEAIRRVEPGGGLRIIYSYFALYGDPLLDTSLDPFPERLLAEYARLGVNGVWLQAVLYQLVEFPFAPEKSAGWQTRIGNLRQLIRRAANYGIGVYLYLN